MVLLLAITMTRTQFAVVQYYDRTHFAMARHCDPEVVRSGPIPLCVNGSNVSRFHSYSRI